MKWRDRTRSFGTQICFRSERTVRISLYTTQLHVTHICICFIRAASGLYRCRYNCDSRHPVKRALSFSPFFSIPFTRTTRTMGSDSPDFDLRRKPVLSARRPQSDLELSDPRGSKMYQTDFALEKIDCETAGCRICIRVQLAQFARDSRRASSNSIFPIVVYSKRKKVILPGGKYDNYFSS